MDFLVEMDLPDGTTQRAIFCGVAIPEGSVIHSVVVSANECVNGWPVGDSFEVPTRVIDTRESAKSP